MEVCNRFISIRSSSTFFFRSQIHKSIKPTGVKSKSSQDKIRVLKELKKETEETLEWQSICSSVSRFTSTSMASSVSRSGNLPFGRDREESQKLLEQTAAAALLPQPLDFSGIEDLSEIVGSAVSGELLTVRQLCAVARSLRAARGVLEQLEKMSSSSENQGDSQRYSPLLEILKNCNFLTELEQKIGFCIDCSLSVVKDQASEKLGFIRSERKRNMESLESLLKVVSTRIFQAGGIDSPLVTKRRSRMCVGIRASHRSLLNGGVILGVSSSGATYFMEPRDAVELNNMEVRLSNSEKAEELAILSLLTSEIAGSEMEIRYLMDKIVELDLASARGSFAHLINGVCPVLGAIHERVELNKTGESLSVDIECIRHPLLLESSLRSLSSVELGNSIQFDGSNGMAKSGRSPEHGADFPVPLDIKIGDTTKVVVISGPNTGGKTATMKTLGLAALMSKAGLYLPAKPSPKLPWFDHVLADIGDHQSLEHNLSTFSGHISRLCKIMEVASSESLVLIDEIGNGTDPSEGVALSTSILQYLADRVNLAVVTTHYGDLSSLKANDARFENAAMEFCVETLQPTYRVLWGSTGTSNALSIAKSIGFDQRLLARAYEWVKKLMPDRQKERKGLLYQFLLEERETLKAQAEKAASALSEIKKLHQEILFEAEDIDRREAALKAKQSQQVHQELEAAKSQIYSVVKAFEEQLNHASSNQLNLSLKESEAAITTILESHCSSGDLSVQESSSSSTYIPQTGDQVQVRGFGNKLATVIETSGNDGNALVQFGKMRVLAKKNDMKVVLNSKRNAVSSSVLHLKEQGPRGIPKQSPTGSATDEEGSFSPVVRTSKNTVDLRGMRAEEAIYHLNMAIAACRSTKVLFIIHGMGSGVIKERVLEILSDNPRVARFEQESPMNYGCTVAYIK